MGETHCRTRVAPTRGRLVVALFATLPLLALATLPGCRDRSTGAGKESPTESAPSSEQEKTRRAEQPVVFEQFLSLDSKQALPAVVALGDAPLCESARKAVGQQAHLICAVGRQGLDAGLRKELTSLKQAAGKSVVAGEALLLASARSLADARRLISQEPSFFSRVAVWGSPEQMRLLGRTFVTNVGPRGAKQVVFVAPDPAEFAALSGIAQRQGVQFQTVRAHSAVPDEASVRKAWELLNLARQQAAQTTEPMGAPAGQVPSAPGPSSK